MSKMLLNLKKALIKMEENLISSHQSIKVFKLKYRYRLSILGVILKYRYNSLPYRWQKI